jgi:hypothetical protein
MNDPKAPEGPTTAKRSFFQLRPGVFVREGSKYRRGEDTWTWRGDSWEGPTPLPVELEFRQYVGESIRPPRGTALPRSI